MTKEGLKKFEWELVNSLIDEAEKGFQKALTNNGKQITLKDLKLNIDYLRDRRLKAFQKMEKILVTLKK